MTPCRQYQSELASCAALEQEPPNPVLAHLQTCAACRTAYAELQSVAAVQVRAASELPTPQKATRLDLSFMRPRPVHAFRFRVLAAAGLAVLAAAFVLVPRFRHAQQIPSQVASVLSPGGTRFEEPHFSGPTLQALRKTIDSDDFLHGASSGLIVGHYRLKDAYTQDH